MTWTAVRQFDQFGSSVTEEGDVLYTFFEDGSERETYWLRYDTAAQWVEQELEILNHPRRDEECEHGLSAGLCRGPQHY